MKALQTRRAGILLLMFVVGAVTTHVQAGDWKFYPDDPIATEIDDQDASRVAPGAAHVVLAGWRDIRGTSDRSSRRAMNATTVDEVPDSNWFTNRIGRRHLSLADLARGPNTLPAPPSGPWTVVAGKSDGVTPGLRLEDAAGRLFFAKFDPPGHPELASGAEVVVTKLLFALGYWVPENYIATVRRDELTISPHATFTTLDGKKRPMRSSDLRRVLKHAARNADGSFRMLASLAVQGRPIGPFQYLGTRPDDPNDIVPHEHRRELRALRVSAAWLNHVDTKAHNSLDTLVQAGPRQVVRHYLIDFGSALGSAGIGPKDWRDGHEYWFDKRSTLLALLTFGTYTPSWRRIDYPDHPAIGRIESRHFDPLEWKPTFPNPAFDNARPDDTFWAAQRVVAFSDDAIRAVVATAAFSDPAAARYLTQVLIDRRDAIGRAWLTDVNAISHPAINGLGQLVFRNAALDAGATDDRPRYDIRWSLFDNTTGVATAIGPWTSVQDACSDLPHVPPSSAFLMAEIAAIHPRHPVWARPVRAYFRHTSGSWVLVGLERPEV